MKQSTYVSTLLLNIKNGIARFVTPFIFSILIFAVSAYAIIAENEDEIIFRLLLTMGLGILTSVLFTLIAEYFEIKLRKLFVDGAVLIPVVICFFALKGFDDNDYVKMGYAGIMIALFCVAVYFCCKQSDRQLVIPHLVKAVVFSGFVSGIIEAGLSVCLWAVDTLIYKIDDVGKYFGVIAVFIWAILFINLFLSNVPAKDTQIRLPKIFRILTLYAALPVYLLLIFILYLYLGKIAVTLKMPVGQINWFASFASLFFIFFLFTIRQYVGENKLDKLFVKLSGYMIIHVIFVQALAIYERLNAYGLTTMRYVSVVLNIIALLFAVFAVIKKTKYIETVFLIAGVVALLATLTPLNILDFPNSNQENRLKNILIANNMLENGSIIPKEDVSKEDQIKITSSYHYVKNSAGKKSDFITQYHQTDFKKVFGFPQEYESNYRNGDNQTNDKNRYGHFSYNYNYIDIAGYTKLYESDDFKREAKQNILKFEIGSEKIEYDFSKEIQRLYRENGLNASNTKMIYDISDRYRLQIKNIDFTVDENDSIKINYANAVILEK